MKLKKMSKDLKFIALLAFIILSLATGAVRISADTGCCTNPNAEVFCSGNARVEQNLCCDANILPAGTTCENYFKPNTDCYTPATAVWIDECKPVCCFTSGIAEFIPRNACRQVSIDESKTDYQSCMAAYAVQCSNGIDDDGNGCADLVDNGCTDTTDTTENGGTCKASTVQCTTDSSSAITPHAFVIGNTVQIRWTDACKNQIDSSKNYEISREGIPSPLVSNTAGPFYSEVIDGTILKLGNTYLYTIKGFYQGNYEKTATVSIPLQLPDVSGKCTITFAPLRISANAVILSWSDTCNDKITSYELKRGEVGAVDSQIISNDKKEQSYSDAISATNVAPGKTYEYTIIPHYAGVTLEGNPPKQSIAIPATATGECSVGLNAQWQKGKPSVELAWSDTCAANAARYEIRRKKKSDSDFSEPLIITQQRTYQDSLATIIDGGDYVYELTVHYTAGADKKAEAAVLKIPALACRGREGKNFCDNELLKQCSADGIITSERDCSKKEKDLGNIDGGVCVQTATGASCEVTLCTHERGQFGFFSKQQTCEYNADQKKQTSCFYDASKTIVDACYPCYATDIVTSNPTYGTKVSCYDFKTKDTCERKPNPCSIETCAWKPYQNTGIGGVCIDSTKSNCEWCNKPGTSDVPSTAAYNSIFSGCTQEKSDLLSQSPQFKCHFSGGKSLDCNAATCSAFAKDDCAADFVLTAGNKISTTRTKNPCDVKVCKAIDNGCFKDADDDGFPDCKNEDGTLIIDCEKDSIPPTTKLTVKETNYGIRYVTIDFENVAAGTDVSKYITYLCVGTETDCKDNWHNHADWSKKWRGTTLRSLPVSSLLLAPGAFTPDIILNHGDNTVWYYSADTAKNVEEIKGPLSIKAFVAETHPLILAEGVGVLYNGGRARKIVSTDAATNGHYTLYAPEIASLEVPLAEPLVDVQSVRTALLGPLSFTGPQITLSADRKKVILTPTAKITEEQKYPFTFDMRKGSLLMNKPCAPTPIDPQLSFCPDAIVVDHTVPAVKLFGRSGADKVELKTNAAGITKSGIFLLEVDEAYGLWKDGFSFKLEKQAIKDDASGVEYKTFNIKIQDAEYSSENLKDIFDFGTNAGPKITISAKSELPLSDGNYKLMLAVEDFAGNKLTQVYEFAVDKTPLDANAITLLTPRNKMSDQNPVPVTIATDNTAKCCWKTGGGYTEFQNTNSIFHHAPIPVEQGTATTVNVKCGLAAETCTAMTISKDFAIEMDRTVPQIKLIGIAPRYDTAGNYIMGQNNELNLANEQRILIPSGTGAKEIIVSFKTVKSGTAIEIAHNTRCTYKIDNEAEVSLGDAEASDYQNKQIPLALNDGDHTLTFSCTSRTAVVSRPLAIPFTISQTDLKITILNPSPANLRDGSTTEFDAVLFAPYAAGDATRNLELQFAVNKKVNCAYRLPPETTWRPFIDASPGILAYSYQKTFTGLSSSVGAYSYEIKCIDSYVSPPAEKIATLHTEVKKSQAALETPVNNKIRVGQTLTGADALNVVYQGAGTPITLFKFESTKKDKCEVIGEGTLKNKLEVIGKAVDSECIINVKDGNNVQIGIIKLEVTEGFAKPIITPVVSPVEKSQLTLEITTGGYMADSLFVYRPNKFDETKVAAVKDAGNPNRFTVDYSLVKGTNTLIARAVQGNTLSESEPITVIYDPKLSPLIQNVIIGETKEIRPTFGQLPERFKFKKTAGDCKIYDLSGTELAAESGPLEGFKISGVRGPDCKVEVKEGINPFAKLGDITIKPITLDITVEYTPPLDKIYQGNEVTFTLKPKEDAAGISLVIETLAAEGDVGTIRKIENCNLQPVCTFAQKFDIAGQQRATITAYRGAAPIPDFKKKLELRVIPLTDNTPPTATISKEGTCLQGALINIICTAHDPELNYKSGKFWIGHCPVDAANPSSCANSINYLVTGEPPKATLKPEVYTYNLNVPSQIGKGLVAKCIAEDSAGALSPDEPFPSLLCIIGDKSENICDTPRIALKTSLPQTVGMGTSQIEFEITKTAAAKELETGFPKTSVKNKKTNQWQELKITPVSGNVYRAELTIDSEKFVKDNPAEAAEFTELAFTAKEKGSPANCIGTTVVKFKADPTQLLPPKTPTITLDSAVCPGDVCKNKRIKIKIVPAPDDGIADDSKIKIGVNGKLQEVAKSANDEYDITLEEVSPSNENTISAKVKRGSDGKESGDATKKITYRPELVPTAETVILNEIKTITPTWGGDVGNFKFSKKSGDCDLLGADGEKFQIKGTKQGRDNCIIDAKDTADKSRGSIKISVVAFAIQAVAFEPKDAVIIDPAPAISLKIKDNPIISKDSIRMTVDGSERLITRPITSDGNENLVIAAASRETLGTKQYDPSGNSGLHTVRVYVRDTLGNEVYHEWKFTIDPLSIRPRAVNLLDRDLAATPLNNLIIDSAKIAKYQDAAKPPIVSIEFAEVIKDSLTVTLNGADISGGRITPSESNIHRYKISPLTDGKYTLSVVRQGSELGPFVFRAFAGQNVVGLTPLEMTAGQPQQFTVTFPVGGVFDTTDKFNFELSGCNFYPTASRPLPAALFTAIASSAGTCKVTIKDETGKIAVGTAEITVKKAPPLEMRSVMITPSGKFDKETKRGYTKEKRPTIDIDFTLPAEISKAELVPRTGSGIAANEQYPLKTSSDTNNRATLDFNAADLAEGEYALKVSIGGTSIEAGKIIVDYTAPSAITITAGTAYQKTMSLDPASKIIFLRGDVTTDTQTRISTLPVKIGVTEANDVELQQAQITGGDNVQMDIRSMLDYSVSGQQKTFTLAADKNILLKEGNYKLSVKLCDNSSNCAKNNNADILEYPFEINVFGPNIRLQSPTYGFKQFDGNPALPVTIQTPDKPARCRYYFDRVTDDDKLRVIKISEMTGLFNTEGVMATTHQATLTISDDKEHELIVKCDESATDSQATSDFARFKVGVQKNEPPLTMTAQAKPAEVVEKAKGATLIVTTSRPTICWYPKVNDKGQTINEYLDGDSIFKIEHRHALSLENEPNGAKSYPITCTDRALYQVSGTATFVIDPSKIKIISKVPPQFEYGTPVVLSVETNKESSCGFKRKSPLPNTETFDMNSVPRTPEMIDDGIYQYTTGDLRTINPDKGGIKGMISPDTTFEYDFEC